MPNRADVELLNNAITNMGEQFARGRQERADRAYRQTLLDRELERQKAATQHYAAEEQHFKNMEEGQKQSNIDKEDKDMFEELTKLNATGALANRDAANKWLSTHPKWGKTGIQLQQPTQAPPAQAGQNSTAQALQKALEFDRLAEQEPDPAKKQRLTDSAATLRRSVEPTDTVTEEYEPIEGKEASPGSEGIAFGIGAKPPTAAVPGQPRMKVTRKVPLGWKPGQAGQPPTAAPPQAPTDPSKRQAGQSYTTPKGVFKWTGTGWAQ